MDQLQEVVEIIESPPTKYTEQNRENDVNLGYHAVQKRLSEPDISALMA